MLKLITYSFLFTIGCFLTQKLDEFEILLYQKISFLNLKVVFFGTRIIIGLLLVQLPLNLLSRIKRLKKILKVCFSILLFSLPFILSPPDSLEFKYKSTSKQQKIHLYSYLKQRQNIPTKNTLLCFLTANCRFCKLAGKKIAVISKELETNDKIQIVLNNDSAEVIKFLKEIDLSLNFTFHKTTFDTLLNICDGRMPTMFLMKNDSIINEYSSRSLNDLEILECLQNN
jgi:hypothetical protein